MGISDGPLRDFAIPGQLTIENAVEPRGTVSDSYSNSGSAELLKASSRSPSVFVQRSCLRNLAVSTASMG